MINILDFNFFHVFFLHTAGPKTNLPLKCVSNTPLKQLSRLEDKKKKKTYSQTAENLLELTLAPHGSTLGPL